MDLSIIISCIAGLILGVIVSFAFSKSYSSDANTIFGINTNSLIKYILLFAVIFSVVLFSALSYLVKDFDYPTANPLYFTLETLFAGFVPASIFYAIMFLRGIPGSTGRNIEYLVLSAKFAIFHILFQFSGFYTYAFSG